MVRAVLLLVALAAASVQAQSACSVCACVGTTVDCSGLSLLALPAQIPNTTTVFRFTDNRLTTLPTQMFVGLTSLIELDLRSNRIQVMTPGAFAGLAQLQILKLDGNGLTALLAGVLDAVPQLRQLQLGSNLLSSLQPDALSALSRLEELRLAGNVLTALHAQTFASLSMLQVLDLSSNRLSGSGLDSTVFSPLQQLISLDLSSNALESIGTRLFAGLGRLQTLRLRNNGLASLPALVLADLVALRTLMLDSGNSLTTISQADLATLTNLTALRLGGNNWDCCGLEFLRTMSAVQDGSLVVCARPQLVAGMSISGTAGAIGVCSRTLPDTPAAPVGTGSVTKTSAQVRWSSVHGNAFAIDYFQVQVALAAEVDASPATAPWRTAECATGQEPMRNDDSSTDMAPCQVLATSEFQTLFVTGLAPFLEYKFRVRAHNDIGFGDWSNASAAIQTLPDTPSQVASVSALATATTITVQWAAPTPPNGILTTYLISLFNALDEVVTLANEAPNSTEHVFSNVNAFTAYRVAVTAFTGVGAGPESARVNISTLQDTPEMPGSSPRALAIAAESVRLGWTAVSGDSANGVIQRYSVYQLPGPVLLRELPASTLEFEVTSLSPATQYQFAFAASTDVGTSQLSAPLTVTTLDAAPSVPLAVAVSPVTSRSLLVSWEPPAQPNGVIVKYEVFQLNSASGLYDLKVHSSDGSVRQVTVQGLAPYTSYSFRVQAFTSLAGGDLSAAQSGTTLQDAPSSVRATSTVLSSTSIRLAFSEPVPANGVITRYRVYQLSSVRALSGFPTIQNSNLTLLSELLPNATAAVLTGLEPATVYVFSVVAFTAVGNSTTEASVTNRTLEDLPSQLQAPVLRPLGDSVIEVAWQRPAQPNGEIVKYEVFHDQSGATPVFSGLPIGRLAANITGLAKDQLYIFYVVAHTAIGRSRDSFVAQARTTTSDTNVTQVVIIVGICLGVVLITLAFMVERRRRQQRAISAKVAPTAATAATAAAAPTTMVAAPIARLPLATGPAAAPTAAGQPATRKPPPPMKFSASPDIQPAVTQPNSKPGAPGAPVFREPYAAIQLQRPSSAGSNASSSSGSSYGEVSAPAARALPPVRATAQFLPPPARLPAVIDKQ